MALLSAPRPSSGPAAGDAPGDDALALFTSLPIYWNEASDVGSMLGEQGRQHWARALIERRRPLHPIDVLDSATLEGHRDLLIVQPRPLSPQENVALDTWVVRGGRLLLFADPALTAESAFAVGDRRRPQDIVLLSPILARWGLALEFEEDQELGERTAALETIRVPVNLPGRFAARARGRKEARCAISSDALVASCRVGAGRVLAIADAALFEQVAEPDALDARRDTLAALLDLTFPH